MTELRDAILICWLAFLAFYISAARSAKRTVERPLGQALYRVLNIAGFVLLFGFGTRLKTSSPLVAQLLPDTRILAAIGLAITVAGLLLALWARLTLGGNWSVTVTLKENHTLVQNGPYSFVRHPIYTAMLLMFLGSAVAFGTVGTVAASRSRSPPSSSRRGKRKR